MCTVEFNSIYNVFEKYQPGLAAFYRIIYKNKIIPLYIITKNKKIHNNIKINAILSSNITYKTLKKLFKFINVTLPNKRFLALKFIEENPYIINKFITVLNKNITKIKPNYLIKL